MDARLLTPGLPSSLTAESGPLARAIAAAAVSAAGALSELAGYPITAESVGQRHVPLSRLSELAGDPECPVVAVYLGVEGQIAGHILLVLSEPMALDLADWLLGQSSGATAVLGPMEVSALAECGNIVGSAFLNALADRAGMMLPPTPPAVFYEMRGAILGSLAAELALSEPDEALVIETGFARQGQTVEAAFFVFDAALVRAISRAAPEEVPGANRR